MADVMFRNVTIWVSAENAATAYAKLCKALAEIGAEWETDIYSVVDANLIEHTRSTEELFPAEGYTGGPGSLARNGEVIGGDRDSDDPCMCCGHVECFEGCDKCVPCDRLRAGLNVEGDEVSE